MDILFIHSSDGRLDCVCLLTFVNNSAKNIGVQVSVSVPVLILLGIYLGVELMDYMVILFHFFEEPPNFTVAGLSFIPVDSVQGFQFHMGHF